MSNFGERLKRWPKGKLAAVSFLTVLLVGVLDYCTGIETSVALFYLAPVWFAGWFAGTGIGILIACASSLIWLVVLLLERAAHGTLVVIVWNDLNRAAIFSAVAFLVAALKRSNDSLAKTLEKRTGSLRDQESRLEAIVQAAAEGIITTNDQGAVESINPAAERMFGYEANEIIGHKVGRLRLLPSRPKGGEPVIDTDGEAEGRRKDGSDFPIELSVSKFHLDGKPKFVEIVRDITLRKRWEEARNRLAAIVESAEDAIISQSLDGTIVSWNAAAGRLFGYALTEVVGQPGSILMPPELQDENAQILERVSRGEHLDVETVRLRNGGSRLNVSLIVSPIRDPGGEIIGISKIVRDITRRRQLEEAMATAAEEERGRIARDLHDGLGQQLGAALFQAELLRRDLAKGGSLEFTRAADIYDLVKRALNQAREVSRGLYPLPPEPDGLMTALQNLADGVSRDRQIDCTFDADSAVLLDDRALATHLYRIAQEALTNALKHSGAGRIEIKLERRAQTLELSVCDHGKGMPGLRKSGIGLQSMTDRARLIGGRLLVHNLQEGGVEVRCLVEKLRTGLPARP